MKDVETWRWFLPRGPGRKPYLSRWHMTEEEAAARGAIAREPTSRRVIRVGETVIERELLRLGTDTSPGAIERTAHVRLMARMLCLPVVRPARWLDDFNQPWGSGFPG